MNTAELLALIFGITTGIFTVVTILQNRTGRLRDEMQTLRTELKTDMQTSNAELKTEMQASKTELKTDMQALKIDMQAIETRLNARINQLANIMEHILVTLIGKSKANHEGQEADSLNDPS